MKINKAQGQSLPRTLGVDLHGQYFSLGRLYVAPSRAKNPRNEFVLRTDGSNRKENVVFSGLFGMRHNILEFANQLYQNIYLQK